MLLFLLTVGDALIIIIIIRVLLCDTTGIKKKSHHNFIRVMIFEQVIKEERK